MNIWDQWMACLWKASWQSAVLTVAVLALNFLLRRRLPAGWRCGLWMLVAVRLMLPVLPSSRVSVFNFLERTERAAAPTIALPAIRTIVTVGYGPIGREDARAASAPGRSDWWPIILAGFWAAGLLILIIRRIMMELHSSKAAARMPAMRDQSVLALVERCRAEMKLRRRLRVVSSNTVRTPAVCGFWRTTLILPADLARDDAELRMVILHELAHVRRWDLQVDRLLSFLRDVHWFNPAAWIMLLCWRREREMACDEKVMRMIGRDQRTQYGRVILNLVERFSNLPPAAGAVGLFESQSGLRSRIIAIKKFKQSKFQSVIGLLVFLGITVSMLTDAKAQNVTAPATMASTQQDQSAAESIRVYDLSDLVLRGMQSVPFSNVPLSDLDNPPKIPSRDEIVSEHAQAIQEIVKALYKAAPDNSWKENGGKGTITQIPGQDQIIVCQTVPNHEKIGGLLANWHHAAEIQVNFEAHFITLPRGTHIQTTKIADLSDGGATYLDDQDVKEFLAAVHHENGSVILEPRVTVFDHQEAYIAIQTQTAYVAGITETNQPGAARYKPQSAIVATGVLLQVCPTITPDHKNVTVKFHARDKRLVELKDVLWMNNPQFHIQKPVVDIHDAQRIFSIPNATTLLLGLKDTGTQASDHSVWLLLRPTIIDPSKLKQLPHGGMLHATGVGAGGA